MDLGLKDKVALVTGASRGIGRAMAERLAAEGAVVACVATSEERAAETVGAIEAAGGRARAYGCDVSSFEEVQALAGRVLEDCGGLHVLVNNAGVTRDNLLMRMKEEDWDRVLDVNLKGAFNTCKAFAKPLMKAGGGRVVNVTSVVGLGGNAGQANYAASKGGLVAFTKSLAKELGSREVCVNAIAPGFIATDMTAELDEGIQSEMQKSIPLRRFGTADEVADLTAFLAGSTGAYITGHVFVIDGGLSA